MEGLPETSRDAVSFAARVSRFSEVLKGKLLPDVPRVRRTQVRRGGVLTLHGMRCRSDQKYRLGVTIGPARRDRGRESPFDVRVGRGTARKERSQAQESRARRRASRG